MPNVLAVYGLLTPGGAIWLQQSVTLVGGVEVSDHTQEASYHHQLVWPSPGGKKVGPRGDPEVFSCQESKLRTRSTSPRKGGPREKGLPQLPRELPRAPIPHLCRGKPPCSLQERAGSESTSLGYPREATVLLIAFISYALASADPGRGL